MRTNKKILAVFITGLLVIMTFMATALPVFAAAFSISLSSYSGVPSSMIYVYGTGLTANGTNTYTMYFGTN